jgi:ribosomal protein L3
MAAVGTWPVMTTIGMESMWAVAMPVTVLVTPGPEVTSATPTRCDDRE